MRFQMYRFLHFLVEILPVASAEESVSSLGSFQPAAASHLVASSGRAFVHLGVWLLSGRCSSARSQTLQEPQ